MKVYIIEVWSMGDDPFTMTASTEERARELAIKALKPHIDEVEEHQAGAEIYETTLDSFSGGVMVAQITCLDDLK